MTKRLLTITVAVLFFTGLSFAATKKAQAAQPKERTFVGVVTDNHCGAKHMGPAAACVKKCVDGGAKLALYSRGKVYVLDPGDQAADHAGERVRVKGTLDGETIHVSSVEVAAASMGKKKM
ncbi:MAG TPA: DUF5818 domain-containing protein [Candidatus Acidoferrales bacterium]|nr:DUF5818 domain-containing protein [Candidatus Acidoferrales bacterium]